MHSKPVDEDRDGTFTDWQMAETLDGPWICVKCEKHDVWFRLWTSDDGGHEDVEYQCRACGRHWWFESDDS